MIPYMNDNKDESIDNDLYYEVDKDSKKVKWYHWLLLNRPLKLVLVFLIAAIAAPALLYHTIFLNSSNLPPSDGMSFGSCLIPRHARLPCGYGNVTNRDKCHTECCYDSANRFCFHRFPSRFSYILNQEWTEDVLLTPRINTVPFGHERRSIREVRLSVDEVSASHLSLTFFKSDEQIIGRRMAEKNYAYNISGKELNVIVNAAQGSIFNTGRGPFIASNDIWEMSFKITDESMFGFGEIPIRENTVKVIYSHRGGMSSVPLIFAKSNGSYHGLLIDTIAPTEVSFRNENQIVVRSITNWGLKFHLFVGPEPADIMRDIRKLTGAVKKIEYWMLGAHICGNQTTLHELQSYITNASNQNMPFESHCGIAPAQFSSECNNTHVMRVNDGAITLRGARKKFMPHVSPYIRLPESADDSSTTTSPTTEATENFTEISNQTEICFDEELYEQYIIHDPEAEQFYIGIVDEQEVIYPKYDNISEEFMKQLWVYTDFDGVILENNWPLDESEKSVNETHRYLPYYNENFEITFQNTPQWNATRPEKHLYTHNKYGDEFAMAFLKVKEDVPILTTSQWMNGIVAINRQSIETSWASLHRELIEMSLGGISGHWYWSSPICGDTENFNNVTQIRLCAKWYMAAIYFPMIQIQSKEIMRDPLAFIGTDRAQMITALRTRMSLLPYFYTVLQEGPLLRPMFYQFPSTDELTSVTTQFSVGDSLLTVPNLHPEQTHVHVVMPPGQWFEFQSGLKIEAEIGQAVTMTTTEADLLTLIRGGSIIIRQMDVRLTTAESQLRSPYTLIVALHCETRNISLERITVTANNNQINNTDPTESTTTEETTTVNPTITKCTAKGKFYISPNMTILFESDANRLKITAEGDDYEQTIWSTWIWYLRVYGLDEKNNNFDHHFEEDININLQDLKDNDEIIHTFVEN